MDPLAVIELHTTFAPTAPTNRPAEPTLLERTIRARHEAQAAFAAGLGLRGAVAS